MVSRYSYVTAALAVAALSSPLALLAPAHADWFDGEILTGGLRKALYDASVATGDSSKDYTANFDTARLRWGAAVPSKVSVTRVYNTTSKPDKYYVVQDNMGQQCYGYTKPYRSTAAGNILVGLHEDWTFSTVAVFYDYMNDQGLTEENKQRIVMHEVGRSLKQAHPGDGVSHQVAVPSSIVPIMGTAQDTSSVLTAYDKDELTSKFP